MTIEGVGVAANITTASIDTTCHRPRIIVVIVAAVIVVVLMLIGVMLVTVSIGD